MKTVRMGIIGCGSITGWDFNDQRIRIGYDSNNA